VRYLTVCRFVFDVEAMGEPVQGVETTAEAVRGRGHLAELYERHAPGAARLAYLLTGDRTQAEDLVQESFVRVVGRFRHLRVPDAFESYLRRTIVNLHTSQIRRRRLERAYLEREKALTREAAVEHDPTERDRLWRELLALPPRQRAAVVLRYYEDLSERETADVLRCSVAAVKSLTARAIETLRTRTEGRAK
jgi:RNA polymerase sigma-70 factor (sigma-E family)